MQHQKHTHILELGLSVVEVVVMVIVLSVVELVEVVVMGIVGIVGQTAGIATCTNIKHDIIEIKCKTLLTHSNATFSHTCIFSITLYNPKSAHAVLRFMDK